jgi:hypothetical protein
MAPRFFSSIVIGAALLLPAGCRHAQRHSAEYVYVVPRQTFLRDRIAAVSNKVAAVQNGERLQVVERSRRFLKLKTPQGQVGWLEEHAAIDQNIYDEFANLRQQHASDPAVATGVLRDEMYAHVSPGRQADRFPLLPENDKVALLMRASLPRPTPEQLYAAQVRKEAAKAAADKAAEDAKMGRPAAPAGQTTASEKPISGKTASAESATAGPEKPVRLANSKPPLASKVHPASAPGKRAAVAATEPPIEDWWLVRDAAGRVGWVLARRVDVDVPDEVVRYAEGQKIVGAYLLAKVPDPESPFPDHQAPEYVTVLNPYKDGLPYDFSMVRVFVWNAKKHRYEGGLREKDLVGYLPVTVKDQSLPDRVSGKTMVQVPTFTLKLAEDGQTPSIDPTTGLIRPVQTFNETFRLDGENVSRVQGAGQAPAAASSASPEEQARQRERIARRAAWKAAHAHARHRRRHS